MKLITYPLGRDSLLSWCLFLTIWFPWQAPGQPQPFVFSTIAGAPGLANVDGTNNEALFSTPLGIARDAGGTLYVADRDSATVRRIERIGTDWVVSTLAGAANQRGVSDGTNSNARFYALAGIAVDSATNLYVLDYNAIRKITPVGNDWVVTTWAGNVISGGTWDGTGTARFISPQGITVDAAGTLYVADTGGNTIRKIQSAGTVGSVTTLAGGTTSSATGFTDGTNRNALFMGPTAIVVDSRTNLFIADAGNQTIRKLTPTRGTSAGTVNWVSTTLAGMVTNSGSADGTNSDARFNNPCGITVDSLGNLYIVDTGNYSIRKLTFSETNAVVSTVAGFPGLPGSADGTNTDARFNLSHGVGLDNAGNLFMADSGNSTVRGIDLSGPSAVVTTLAGLAGGRCIDGPGSAARFWLPSQIALDPQGNLFVADRLNHVIRVLNREANGWTVKTIAGSIGIIGSADGTNNDARFASPQSVAVDNAGNAYVADSANNTIRKLTPQGSDWVVSTIAGLVGVSGSVDGTNGEARFALPAGITTDNAGRIYVADGSRPLIRQITPIGTDWVVKTIAGTPFGFGSADGTNTDARFYSLAGMATDTAGNIYVCDWSNHTIRKLTPVGFDWVTTTIAGLAGSRGIADGTNSDARFSSPQAVTVDGAGNLYVADSLNMTVRKLTPSGTNWVVTTIGGLAGVSGTADGVGSQARFYLSRGIAADGAGNIFVADSFNDTIRFGQPVPALSIGASGDQLVLSWPLSGSNYVLQTSTTLLETGSWTKVDATPTISGGTLFVTNAISGEGSFYRLQMP